MRLSDLAALAGVSTATVSRALSGHSSVNKDTQSRIRDLAEKHGVRPNQLARNLRLKNTGAIGLVMPLGHARTQHLTDPFFLSLLGFLADLLVDEGYDILLTRVLPDDTDWLDGLIAAGRTDGLLIIGQSDQFEVIERAAERYKPLVVWGVHREGQIHATVGSDNILGGLIAGEQLIARGRKRLLFVGDPAPPEFADRVEGFRQAASAAGLAIDVLPTAMDPVSAHTAIKAYLAANSRPDGIFTGSDVVAMSVLRGCQEAGIRIPDDASVVGYDDVTLAAQTSPPLSTIRQDLETGARAMVDLLIKRIAGEPTDSVLLPPVYVQRYSL